MHQKELSPIAMRFFQIPACTENFARILAFARDFCAMADADSNLSVRLMLVLEELFTNTVAHGCHGAGSLVRIELKQTPGYVSIKYEDDASPFDPLNAISLDPATAVENGQIGGMGLPLIRKMADSITYERQEPWNRTIILLAREAMQGNTESP